MSPSIRKCRAYRFDWSEAALAGDSYTAVVYGDPALSTKKEQLMKLVEQTYAPFGTLVILQMFPVGESRGGIKLPETVGELSRNSVESPRGLVVAVGPMVKNDIRRGDEVILAGGSYTTVIHEGRELVAVVEDRIVGRVNDINRVKNAIKEEWDNPRTGLQRSGGS